MNRFALGIGWRIAGIVVFTGTIVTLYWQQANSFWLTLLLIPAFVLAVNLYHYTTGLNRKLTRFLESVRYSDFAVAFRADSNLGPTFHSLNDQFNEVLGAFRQARAEKEANLHYVNTIVQHVSVGLLTFDAAGQVELTNQTALRLLGIYRLRTLSDLNATHPDLVALLRSETQSSAPVVYQPGNGNELSVRCTSVRLRGRLVTVVSLQNIGTELQQRELEAWQNLTKVLRHEIMNSITPIVSLAGTMRDIVETDLVPALEPDPAGPADQPEAASGAAMAGALTDLRDALMTIEQRGEGIMRFVDAYRHFTSIPQPVLDEVSVEQLLRHIEQLVLPNAQKLGIQFSTSSPNLIVKADLGQIEMVLINLIKNAVESLEKTQNPRIQLEAVPDGQHVVISVSDNGPGIEPEALEQIFIPFFTTKKTGSGIGLSLSRQIMQLHGGHLTADSVPGQGSTFRLIF
ncbi:sensor histidine kinase [Spirosoma sordidisoli]|uniref:histidine kinase n=1 Tax=Spirosoma sordidisoli TaxID=2502893 RepID=A0A4Q2UHM9_9BACT|nr:ATP-binding protein [Spirosoma sordidisoli]RYC68917.1 GHKL domain-containing protein [Spirosoma sordidisoli]